MTDVPARIREQATDADIEFRSWVGTLPSSHWAKYDLSAVRLGWDAARSQNVGQVLPRGAASLLLGEFVVAARAAGFPESKIESVAAKVRAALTPQGAEMSDLDHKAELADIKDRLRNMTDAMVALLPRKPDMDAKDGPCCHSLDPRFNCYVCDGCSCGNADDTARAGEWAAEANAYLSAKHKLRILGFDLDALLAERSAP